MTWWPWQGLSWRLTVSYVLVTLIAALTIEAASAILPPGQDPEARRTLPEVLLVRTAPLATYLQETGIPDQYDIQSLFLNPILDNVGGRTTGPYGVVVLLDPHRHILATAMTAFRHGVDAASVVAPGPAPSIQRLVATTTRQRVIQQALTASRDDTILTDPGADGFTMLAVPIRSTDGPVRGVLAALFDGAERGVASPPQDFASVWGRFIDELTPAGVYFIVLASIIGTLTGIVISRNLAWRLHRITIAAAAWSQGTFQAEVSDPSTDELGQLGRALNRMAGQLHALLTTRQDLAVLEERTRLARELHDSVKQHVFANALLVRAARTLLTRDPDKARAALREAEELAGQAQHELIALIRALRPATLADHGLAGATQECAGDWSRRMGVAVDVRVQGERTTPLDIEEALFRVTQESLANVARHSQARQVDVQLAWSAERLALTIADDGQGFDVAHAMGTGWGLRHMRERMNALGGTLTVTSTAEGTRIEAVVPLDSRSRHEGAP